MIVLGSTGSIGVNTLYIAQKYNLKIDILSAGYNAILLNKQLEYFNPRVVVVANKEVAQNVKHSNVKYGQESLLEEMERSESELVVNAFVGFLGLSPTLRAIELGKKVALANKESLVVAGKFIDMSKIIPIDSEHYSLQCILDKQKTVQKVFVTASGGALRDRPINTMDSVSIRDVLAHPNWSMGNKITVDSATMCNKLFELIEAKWLFEAQEYDAVIETSSSVHAMVEYVDGSLVAHLAQPDMKLPIACAILGNMKERIISRIDPLQLGNLSFRPIDKIRYPIWELKDFMLEHLDLGVVLNASNEIAVQKFLASEIAYQDIFPIIKKTVQYFQEVRINRTEDLFTVDKEVRKYANAQKGSL